MTHIGEIAEAARAELVITSEHRFHLPRWRCETHGELGGEAVIIVSIPGRAEKSYCVHCVLEALERIGLTPIPRVD